MPYALCSLLYALCSLRSALCPLHLSLIPHRSLPLPSALSAAVLKFTPPAQLNVFDFLFNRGGMHFFYFTGARRSFWPFPHPPSLPADFAPHFPRDNIGLIFTDFFDIGNHDLLMWLLGRRVVHRGHPMGKGLREYKAGACQ